MEPIIRDAAAQFVFVLFTGFMSFIAVSAFVEHALNSKMARIRERSRNVN